MTRAAQGGHLEAAEDRYAELLEQAASSDNVVGVVLTGSRAAGAFVTEDSDFDAYVVVRESEQGWQTPRGASVEIWPMMIAAFRRHALPGSGTEWDRPSFLYAHVELDKLGGGWNASSIASVD